MKINKKAKLADLLKKNPDMTLEDLLESTASGKKKRSKKDDGIKNDKLKELQEEAFNKELEGKTGVIGRLKGGVKGAQKSFELQQEFKTAKTGVKSRYGNIAKAFGADPKSAAMIDRIFGKKVDDKELTKLREKFNLDEKAKPKKEKKEAEKKETVQKDLTDNISKIFDIVKEIRSVVEGIANKLGASSSKEVPTTKKAMRKLEKDSGLKYSKETGRYHDIKTNKMVGAETARQKMNLSPSALKVAGVENSGAALAGAAAGGTATASKVMEGKAETVKGPNPATEEEVAKVGESVDKVGETVDSVLDMFSLKKFYGLIGGAFGAAFPLLIKAGKLIYEFFSSELDLYKKIGSAIWDFLKDMLLKVDFTLPFPKVLGGPIHFAPFSFLKGSDAAAPVPPKEGAAPPKAPPKEPAAAPEAAPAPPEAAPAEPQAPQAAPQAPQAAPQAAPAPAAPTAAPVGSNMPGGAPPKPSAAAAAAPKVSGMDDVKKMIKQHEGVRYQAYKDTKGLWTIGVGHLIGDGSDAALEKSGYKGRTLTEKEVDSLFEEDFAHHVKIAEKTPGWNLANDTGKAAMIDLAFNMGAWWQKFKNTAKSLANGDFAAAADGLTNSAWFTQVGKRAQTVVAMIKNGSDENSTKVDATSQGDNKLAAVSGGETRVASAGAPTVTPTKAASSVDSTPTSGQTVAANTTEVTAAKEQMVASNVSPAPRISVPARPQASPKPPNPDHSVKASARLVEDTFTRALAKDFSHPSAFTTVSMV
jgi:GH24 family phage-related lysozyme (muramidase)